MNIDEILVLHHSHLDIGYTHSQPILWELQREYIDLALDFLDQTADYPAISLPRWTCEVTAPVEQWLATASERNIERFQRYVTDGRIGISALALNTTPLCNAEQLARQLYPARRLREQLGAAIRTVNQHDVNGIPWSLADLLIDSNVELLTMAINIHLGRAVTPRPAAFRWQAPSGRELLVMNGNHYTMFDQLLYTWEDSVERMATGLAEYMSVLAQRGYPHNFLYLTTTYVPAQWDNSPPNMAVARLIRQWNEEGRQPRIRYVTPEGLLERLRSIPPETLPLQRGDWTDYWNFGCASTAYETRLNQGSKPRVFVSELLRTAQAAPLSVAERDVAARAWRALNLYDEHTWGYHDTTPGHPHGRAQERLKLQHAYEARELADYRLVSELEALAGNPPEWRGQQGVLLVNPAGYAQSAYVTVPAQWRTDAKWVRAQQFSYAHLYQRSGQLYGPVELPPYGWRHVALDELQPVTADQRVRVEGWPAATNVPGNTAAIETPYYRLSFDPATGRIHSLIDRRQDWEVLDQNSPFTFFEFVRERTDDLVDDRVEAYYERDMLKEKYDGVCWKTEWKAVRERAERCTACRVEHDLLSATLVLQFEAPGVANLIQRITLHANTPLIDLDVRFDKLYRAEPEGIYFTFPLNLPADWNCHFDSAGIPIELDAEQLPRACRDWFTVESYACMHGGNHAATLYCPDAPMIQAGDFNFGKLQDSIPRQAQPLLLAWPMNNYWNTNFPRVQPGSLHFQYTFTTHPEFDPFRAAAEGRAVAAPVIAHPLHRLGAVHEGQLVKVEGDQIAVTHVKLAEDGMDAIVRLVNLGTDPVRTRVAIGDEPLAAAFLTGALEDNRTEVPIVRGAAEIMLVPRQITTLRLIRTR